MFRQHHRGVRFTCEHPSLILTGSFLPDGMPVPRWKCVFGMGLLTPSFLHVFCFLSALANPGIVSQMLSLFVLPQAIYNLTKEPGPALQGCYLERKWTLHCWVMPVLMPAILLWRSKQDSDFLFPLGFCSATVLYVGFHWHHKSRLMW